MDFELTDTHRMIQQTAREFAEKQVKPLARKVDREHYFPKENVRRLAELGFLGMYMPESMGGAGLDVMAYTLAMEEIAAACATTSTIMSVNNSLVCQALLDFGTAEQKETILKPLARGDKLGCFCLSEPDTGSDAAAQKTRAAKRNDEWVVSGAKNFITNGPYADAALLFAMTDPAKGVKGITCFLVDTKTPGWIVGKPEDKLGICGSATTTITLEDVRVPAGRVLGEVNGGFRVAMKVLDGGRIGIAAQALGVARAAFEAALAYSKERKAFGQPICENQGIQWYLCEMAVRIENARNLVHKAAWLKDNKKSYGTMASMAKLYASESANWIASKALQIHGGNGYLKDYDVERYFRDARITEIYEGTTEIQRLVIARALLK